MKVLLADQHSMESTPCYQGIQRLAISSTLGEAFS